MRETREITIGANTFAIKQLPASKARHALRRLMKAAAPLADMQAGTKLAELVAKIVDRIDDDDLDSLTDAFLHDCRVRTPKSGGAFVPMTAEYADDLFAGAGMTDWLKWMRESVEFNFGGFFAAAGAEFADVLGASSAESASPSASTGSSTESQAAESMRAG